MLQSKPIPFEGQELSKLICLFAFQAQKIYIWPLRCSSLPLYDGLRRELPHRHSQCSLKYSLSKLSSQCSERSFAIRTELVMSLQICKSDYLAAHTQSCPEYFLGFIYLWIAIAAVFQFISVWGLFPHQDFWFQHNSFPLCRNSKVLICQQE